ncbi:hypothetical protein AHAS_Ahas13G0254000 [Arachis hypogaea]
MTRNHHGNGVVKEEAGFFQGGPELELCRAGCLMPLNALMLACYYFDYFVYNAVGRIIEDIAKVSIPAYEPTDKGLTRFYPSIPKQHNGCDCGVYVIKFMQYWSLDKPLQFWDKEFQKEIILDIVMGSHNSVIGKALDAFDSHLVYRNQQRNKTKAVRSSFTAPSTKTMLQLVGCRYFKHCTAFCRNQKTRQVS